jgi:type I restriction enzyme R subunit
MYIYPLASSSQTIKTRFDSNEFSITRQIVTQQNQKPDMVIFINGLPIITMELKKLSQQGGNGQSAKVQGIKQYKNRDTKDNLYNFARCIVHFAIDENEAYMTTKLDGKKTFFLPFNKGNNHGKGNPINPDRHKPAYIYVCVRIYLTILSKLIICYLFKTIKYIKCLLM